jgi:hypothetical protein
MDEFHSFNDPERGIVWELTLGLLPRHIRLLLLSATVGNSREFLDWLQRCHGRKVQLVEGSERRVPLTYQWVGDELLNEQITRMAEGDEASRTTPALVFCFNRDECWEVAEQLKGRSLVEDARRTRLMAEVNSLDLSRGVGPKLKQMLIRGVGVHHAGMLPRYRRLVEDLYVRKLLSVCICTETLAAGINLPARSVVLTTLMKGPFGNKRLIDPSSAHQIFGRAGRPQFDTRGYVFVMAHEDDVRILRWKQKYDSIPENTKDPGLLKAKKDLKRKRPTRRDTEQYWNEAQFEKLKAAPPGKLASRGHLPWRLLAYMLTLSPEVDRLRQAVRKRLMDLKGIEHGEQELSRMLITLHHGGFVRLEPEPPKASEDDTAVGRIVNPSAKSPPRRGLLGTILEDEDDLENEADDTEPEGAKLFLPALAHPTEKLPALLLFKSVNPLYGAFLLDQLGIADAAERLQALESVLELPRPLLKHVRVPFPDELPPGPLARERLDEELIRRGLMLAPVPPGEDDEEEDRPYVPPLAEKLRLLFDAEYPGVHSLHTQPVWAAGRLLEFAGKFDNYIKSYDLVKQEGLIFRHLLRLILLCAEFAAGSPPDVDPSTWQADLRSLADQFTATCREVDPESTDKMIEELTAADVVKGEVA